MIPRTLLCILNSVIFLLDVKYMVALRCKVPLGGKCLNSCRIVFTTYTKANKKHPKIFVV